LYTSQWLDVYTVTRISNNNLLTSEMDSLEQLDVLLNINDSVVIDSSDFFFGPGNNGRDCIARINEKDEVYDDQAIDCFFQNDQHSYFSTDYLKGEVRTTGIARYNNKYQFSIQFYNGVDNAQGYLATLVPKDDADFDFFVDISVSACPKIKNRIGISTGCRVDMSYTNTSYPKAFQLVQNGTQYDSLVVQANLINFAINIKQGKTLLKFNGTECYILNCVNINENVVVELEVPNFEVFSSTDASFIGSIDLYSDLNYTKSEVAGIKQKLDEARASLLNISEKLSQLDFNITDKNPFGNFTDLRLKLDFLLGLLNSTNSTDGINSEVKCKGAFGSATCFLEDFGAALITGAIITVAVIVAFLIIRQKAGKHKKKKEAKRKIKLTIMMNNL